MIWNLADYACLSEITNLDQVLIPITFLATPISLDPVYITTGQLSLSVTAPYAVLKVMSWDSNGKPAKGVEFSWHYRSQYHQMIVQ